MVETKRSVLEWKLKCVNFRAKRMEATESRGSAKGRRSWCMQCAPAPYKGLGLYFTFTIFFIFLGKCYHHLLDLISTPPICNKILLVKILTFSFYNQKLKEFH
jgi:hypothetical protein